MNLLDRIKASKVATGEAAAESFITDFLSSIEKNSSSADDEDMFCLTDSAPRPDLPLGQQSYELPNRALFLAIYEAALRQSHPFHVIEFREYKKWLLDGSCYVLNTFRHLDADRLLILYLKWLPPQSVEALASLVQLLWQIDLFVPEDYQRDFEQIIIDEGERLTKNFA